MVRVFEYVIWYVQDKRMKRKTFTNPKTASKWIDSMYHGEDTFRVKRIEGVVRIKEKKAS